jgi:cytidylate kinase
MSPSRSHTPAIQRVIERRLRNWEIQKGQKPGASPIQTPSVYPYIALSREAQSGAGRIARLLADRLHWPLFDKEILDHMAADDGVRHRMYSLMDENKQDWLDEILRPLALGAETLRNDYFRRLRAAVGTIAAHESTVFLGRGAGYLLPPERGLHVRLVASRRVRAARLARQADLSESAAAEKLDRVDQERSRFLAAHFMADPCQPARFDLVLNTDQFSDEAVADLIASALSLKLDGAVTGV